MTLMLGNVKNVFQMVFLDGSRSLVHYLTCATLWANSADDLSFLSYLFMKTSLKFRANYLQWRQYAWNV